MAKLRVSPERRLGIDLAGSELDLIDQLIAFRRIRGLTQEEVAEKMGVERSTVSRFERSAGSPRKNHTLSTVKRYAEAVNAYIAHFVVSGIDESCQAPSYVVLRDGMQEHLSRLRNHGADEASGNDAQKAITEAVTVAQIQATPRWRSTPPAQPVHRPMVSRTKESA